MRHRGAITDDLQLQLQKWGIATVSRFAVTADGYSPGDSVLARQRDLGMRSKRKKDDERTLVGRDGEERRRFMAERNGFLEKTGVGILPMWACDPVRSKNDASPPGDLPTARIDIGIPDELRWVDRALSSLERQTPIRALVLREEYCGTGTQRMKARRVAEQYGGSMSVRQYRYELQRAMDWLRGRIAA